MRQRPSPILTTGATYSLLPWARSAGSSSLGGSTRAKVIALSRGLSCVEVDYDELRGMKPDDLTL
ncbi:hypothetical protein [Pseudonocardia alaniniphila]|uniref:Uncharacterized protein n=1 Tax=Pseudonocardia alaniniphila TaxID=75291 RepID=A0ABS9TCL8_9PSEU|nr:hypothetical protein [Pseudonocardia alaniniphila]MCH6166285.1 hypothetical protein [Pseudonocardia alaniniphila]